MRRLLPVLALAVLSAPGPAQVLPDDIFVSVWSGSPSIDHYRADGTLVRRLAVGTGGNWRGAALTPGGRIVTTRAFDSGVNLFDPLTGAQVGTFPTLQLGELADVGVFSDGTLVVVARASNSIEYYSQVGVPLLSLTPASMSYPWGCFVDESDHLWVCAGAFAPAGNVYEFDRSGALLREFAVPFEPGDLIKAPDGTLWITDRSFGVVRHYGGAGGVLGSFVPSLCCDLSGIAMAADGTLWLSAAGESRLYRYDASGNRLESFPVVSPGAPAFISIPRVTPPAEVYCSAKINSQGCLPVLSTSGFAHATRGVPFRVTATNVTSNKLGLMLYSLDGRASIPFQGGTLCVFPPLKTTRPRFSGGNPPPDDCSGVLSLNFNVRARLGLDPALVHSALVQAQFYYRDPASPSTTGLTNAVEFTIGP